MKFSSILTYAAVAVAGANAELVDVDIQGLLGFDLSRDNHYGAPLAPWVKGARPGWYFGNYPDKYPGFPCLGPIICKILWWFPHLIHCPPKPPHFPPVNDGYQQTFKNLTGATQADGYLTFGLVDTVADCKAMCNSVEGCKFANSYHDVNGKDGSTKLTCSLFNKCYDASTATNKGGQTQPDGSVNYITNSDGYCKKK